MDGGRFYLETGPFKTEEDHWEYIDELVRELHSELVDIGAVYMDGTPESDLAKAVAEARRAAMARNAPKAP